MIPVTTPVVGSIVATDVVALLHVPPDTTHPSVVVEPGQTERVPVMPGEYVVNTISLPYTVPQSSVA